MDEMQVKAIATYFAQKVIDTFSNEDFDFDYLVENISNSISTGK